jgi:rubrerythrin
MDQTTRQDALKALEWGAVTEWLGYRFYLKAAEQTENERGQALFLGLAKDETSHMHIILAEHRALSQGQGWMDYEKALSVPVKFDITGPNPFPEAGKGMKPLFPPLEQVGGVVNQLATDVKAMTVAMDFEKRGYDMYKEQAGKVTDAAGKQAYELLAKEENRHYTWLQQSLDYLTHNHTWWDTEERPFFEG